MKTALFLSLLFTALTMTAGFAHLMELPAKIKLSHDDYLVVQHIYNGWALLGIVVYGSILSLLALTLTTRRHARLFRLSLSAFLCMIATQVLFWTFTFPANQQTQNWTMLPANWMALRARWEYSHAASAVLELAALILLITAALGEFRPVSREA